MFDLRPTNLNNAGYNVSSGGGYGYVLSGLGAPSGDVSSTGFATSGPWYIEEQWKTVTYRRVPEAYPRNTMHESVSVSLSGVDSDYIDGVYGGSANVAGTRMICNVVAAVESHKSYDLYSASAYQQPQKFTAYPASSDHRGITYGAITASSLGCAGSILTTQKFHVRRPWNSNTDSEFSQSITRGYNYQVDTSSDGAIFVSGNSAEDAVWTQDLRFLQRGGWGYDNPGGWNDLYECRGISREHFLLQKGGPYNTGQDSPADILNLLYSLGIDVRNTTLFDSNRVSGFSGDMSNYQTSRYDFS